MLSTTIRYDTMMTTTTCGEFSSQVYIFCIQHIYIYMYSECVDPSCRALLLIAKRVELRGRLGVCVCSVYVLLNKCLWDLCVCSCFVCCRPSEQTIRPPAIFATMLSDLVFPFFVYYIEAGDLVCVFAAIANRQTCTMCFGLNE